MGYSIYPFTRTVLPKKGNAFDLFIDATAQKNNSDLLEFKETINWIFGQC